MFCRVYLISFLLVFLFCSFKSDNPLDESGPNYIPPSIIIDSTSIKDGDTIKGNTVLLALSGNAPENQFRVRIKDEEWSPWFNAGSYVLDSLPEGIQIIELCGRYDGGDFYTYDSIFIYVLKSPIIDTLSLLDTITITDTITLSDSVKVSYTLKVSDIVMVMDSLNLPGTSMVGGMLDTIRIVDTIRIIDTIKITNKDNVIDTVRISDTIKIIDTIKVSDTVDIIDTVEVLDTVEVIDTIKVSDSLYTIKYDGKESDGGTIPIDTGKYLEGSVAVIKEGIPLQMLYKFVGWKSNISEISKLYNEGDTLIIGKSDIILEAQWESIPSYQVKLDGNGHTSGQFPPPIYMSEGEYFYIPYIVFIEKEGYVLSTWNTEKNGKGKSYNPGDKVRIEGNLVLYAQWEKAKTSSLIYVCEDCDNDDLSESIKNTSDSFVIIDSITYGKTGYTFKEWNSSKDGSGKGYKVGDTIIIQDKDIKLYAQWNNPLGMVLIPSKDKMFVMGGSMFEIEWPHRNVKLTRDIWFDTVEVTRLSFNKVMKEVYPDLIEYYYSGKDKNKPANNVNWYGAVLYCNARTRLSNSTDTIFKYTQRTNVFSEGYELTDLAIDLDKKGFRLPSEAEWEFAARGGLDWGGLNEDDISKIAWYRNNSDEEIHVVATKSSNQYHLFDMIGNVSEWAIDWYYPYEVDTTIEQIFIDPINIETHLNANTGRMHRGGNVTYESNRASWSFREYSLPSTSDTYIGFRCCLPVY